MTPFFYQRLADYVRAVHALGAVEDEEQQRAIARILGLLDPPPLETAPKIVDGGGEARDLVEPRPAAPDAPRTPVTGSGAAPTSAPQPRRRKPVTYTIDPPTTASHTRPAWLDEPELFDPPRPAAPRAKPLPLLRPRWSRAILGTAMATRTETNQVDVAAILEAELRGVLLRRIPRRIVPGLSRGVQVLVDRGPSAEPFYDDQELLVGQIRSVGGRDTVSVVELDSARGLRASVPDGEDGDYFEKFRAPAGAVVVLVSDLGIARVPFEQTAQPADWLRFVTRLRDGGNPVIAFVPFGPRRWPSELARVVAMVPWDRTTNVQAVRRALRRAVR